MNKLDAIFQGWVDRLLMQLGLSNDWAVALDRWIVLGIILLVALTTDAVFRYLVVRLVRKVVARTKASWDDILFESSVMRRLCNIITPILVYVLLPVAFPAHVEEIQGVRLFLTHLVEIYLIISVVRFVNAFLRAVFELAEHRPEWQGKPIKGLMQTGQVIMISIAAILIVSILINKSPTILLTGLGASAAVMMLIFRDSILGLVAGVQLSANNMLKVGDWISMPKYGVDGVVEEVALTIVKVRQWDNTLAMLPPYLLISESFANWQAMRDSGGRRIKRSGNIDTTSVRIMTEERISQLLGDESIASLLKDLPMQSLEGAPLTNLDLFMRAVNRYLDQHPRVNHNLMVLVRQLQPTQWGLPVELYCFSANVNWVPYEQLQAEVISYTVALAPHFGLRLFQSPTTQDLEGLTRTES